MVKRVQIISSFKYTDVSMKNNRFISRTKDIKIHNELLVSVLTQAHIHFPLWFRLKFNYWTYFSKWTLDGESSDGVIGHEMGHSLEQGLAVENTFWIHLLSYRYKQGGQFPIMDLYGIIGALLSRTLYVYR